MITRRTLGLGAAAGLAAPLIRPARAAVRLRLGISHTANDNYGAAASAIAQAFKAGSDGRMEIEVFADGVLGSEESMLAAVRAGTLDLTIVASGLLGKYVPQIGLLDLPFLFRDSDHARAVLDGTTGSDYAEMCYAAGIPVLAWAENGLRHLTANRPIRSAAELKGLKLRIMPAPLLLQSFQLMGADASMLSMGLVYEALRIGQFDAQENPIAIIVASQLYEVQSHLMLTGHSYSAACVATSPDLIEDLSAADRKLLKAAGRAAADASRQFITRSLSSGLATLRSHGMTVVADLDIDSFRQAAARAFEAASAKFGSNEIDRLRSS